MRAHATEIVFLAARRPCPVCSSPAGGPCLKRQTAEACYRERSEATRPEEGDRAAPVKVPHEAA